MLFITSRPLRAWPVLYILYFSFLWYYNIAQQYSLDDEPPQSHEGAPPVSIPFIMPDAHPTPEFTPIAPYLQLRAQAPHSMHKSLSTTPTFLFFKENTPWGHTSMHIKQLVHFSAKNLRIDTFLRYFTWPPIYKVYKLSIKEPILQPILNKRAKLFLIPSWRRTYS